MCIRDSSHTSSEIISVVKSIAPTFGGINLEDIAAPICFEVEEALQDIGIPVFHDDQHGTAIVLLAGLLNAIKVVEKPLSSLSVVINGAGAAGTAIANLLRCSGQESCSCVSVKDVLVCDSKGIISSKRSDLNPYKQGLLKNTNLNDRSGTLNDALKGADVFIGVSKGNILTAEHIKLMNPKSIVFAMANPIPEIMPDVAKAAGAFVVGTGRSDFPNQINNVLAFPGIFRGALDAMATKISDSMKIAAAHALASSIPENELSAEKVLASPLDRTISGKIALAVKNAAIEEGVVRKQNCSKG